MMHGIASRTAAMNAARGMVHAVKRQQQRARARGRVSHAASQHLGLHAALTGCPRGHPYGTG